MNLTVKAIQIPIKIHEKRIFNDTVKIVPWIIPIKKQLRIINGYNFLINNHHNFIKKKLIFIILQINRFPINDWINKL